MTFSDLQAWVDGSEAITAGNRPCDFPHLRYRDSRMCTRCRRVRACPIHGRIIEGLWYCGVCAPKENASG